MNPVRGQREVLQNHFLTVLLITVITFDISYKQKPWLKVSSNCWVFYFRDSIWNSMKYILGWIPDAELFVPAESASVHRRIWVLFPDHELWSSVPCQGHVWDQFWRGAGFDRRSYKKSEACKNSVVESRFLSRFFSNLFPWQRLIKWCSNWKEALCFETYYCFQFRQHWGVCTHTHAWACMYVCVLVGQTVGWLVHLICSVLFSRI